MAGREGRQAGGQAAALAAAALALAAAAAPEHGHAQGGSAFLEGTGATEALTPPAQAQSLPRRAQGGGARLRVSNAGAGPDHDDSYRYRLPYGENVSYVVLQGYGSDFSHFGADQYAVDFAMEEGTPVHAARDGVVIEIETSHERGCGSSACAHSANFLVVLHADGTTGEYFHIRKNGALVALGEAVERGQPIALSGNTGYSSAPHLHFGVYGRRQDGRPTSIGVRFQTREGLIEAPRRGARYQNAD